MHHSACTAQQCSLGASRGFSRVFPIQLRSCPRTRGTGAPALPTSLVPRCRSLCQWRCWGRVSSPAMHTFHCSGVPPPCENALLLATCKTPWRSGAGHAGSRRRFNSWRCGAAARAQRTRCCLLFMSASPRGTPGRALPSLGRPILQTSNPTHDHATPNHDSMKAVPLSTRQFLSHRSPVRPWKALYVVP